MLGGLEFEGCRLEDWRRTSPVVRVEFMPVCGASLFQIPRRASRCMGWFQTSFLLLELELTVIIVSKL